MRDLDRKIEKALYQLVQVDKVHSQVEVSKGIGISKAMVSFIVNGKRACPEDKREELFKFFGMTKKEFLDYPRKRARALSVAEDVSTYPPAPDLVEIKYFPDVQASAGTGIINYDESVSAMTFDKDFLIAQFGTRHFQNIHIISAVGDSMEPGIMDGDLLFINPGERDLISGGIFCVWVDKNVLVKRISYNPITKEVKLLSDNDKYEPVILENYQDQNMFRVIGKLMGVFKKT